MRKRLYRLRMRKQLVEALLNTYRVRSVKNNGVMTASGRINLPHCLIGKKVKLRLVR